MMTPKRPIAVGIPLCSTSGLTYAAHLINLGSRLGCGGADCTLESLDQGRIVA